MNWPKYRDGLSQIGQSGAFTLETPGTPIGKTGIMNEVREDGTPGTVRVKRMGEFTDVRREAGPTQGEPFLSTWHANRMLMPDKYMAARTAKLFVEGGGELVPEGNCKYLGGGLSVGVTRVVPPPNANADTFVVVLVSHPRPGKMLTVKEFRDLPDSSPRSVRFEPLVVEGAVGGGNGFSDPYVVPMGWDKREEEYKFAFVATPTRLDTGARQHRVWIGGSKTLDLIERPNWLAGVAPLALSDDTPVMCSLLSCTAPGRLETIVTVPDRPTFENVRVDRGAFPLAWRYKNLRRNENNPPAGPVSLYGWPAGQWNNSSTNSSGQDIDFGAVLFVDVYTELVTLSPLKPSMFIVRSDDFGVTWQACREPVLELKSEENSPAYVSVLPLYDYRTVLPPLPPGINESDFAIMALNATWSRFLVGTSWQVTAVWPSPTELFPPQLIRNRSLLEPITNKGGCVVVGSGSVSFALVPAFVEYTVIYTETRAYAWPISNIAERAPFEIPPTGYLPRYAPRMFRKVGDGAYQPVPWPGDRFMTSPKFDASDRLPPQQPFDIDPFTTPRTLAWGSTGEGCAAFFLGGAQAGVGTAGANGRVTMIATIDGGDTWVERTILNSYNFRESCLIAADKDDGCSFIYAEFKDGMRQLKRISSDLTKVTDYGKPYPAPDRPGLINFQRHVHPGFPGIYDGPKEQPR